MGLHFGYDQCCLVYRLICAVVLNLCKGKVPMTGVVNCRDSCLLAAG